MKLNFPTKRTKIVCTIGPSSWDVEPMTKMIENGMNVARINGAFADVPELERVAKVIRSISDDVAILLDIKGNEIRLNKFAEPINIKPGDEIILGSDATERIYPVTYPDLYKDIAAGQMMKIDKGEVTMVVTKIENKKIYCTILTGDVIKGGKGMNIPGAHLKNPAITPRDIEQIKFACADNWDFVAGSFIRNASDVEITRKVMTNPKLKFIAKIEDQQGIDNFEEILKASDGIMIARGDLGSEVPMERLPILQKEMIAFCNHAAKPVITATNMLESMIEKPFPTRAEVTDVANAVLEGTDALMTSGETTSGKYPVETLDMMSRIAVENEKYIDPDMIPVEFFEDKQVAVAISNAAYEMATTLELDAIVTLSSNDTMPRLISRFSLPCKIISLLQDTGLKRQLNMSKGVEAVEFIREFTDRDDAANSVKAFLKEKNLVKKGEKILILGKFQGKSEKITNYPNFFEFIQID